MSRATVWRQYQRGEEGEYTTLENGINRFNSRIRSIGMIANWLIKFGPTGFLNRLRKFLDLRHTSFDLEAYNVLYPDAAGCHPIVHYVDAGHFEGRCTTAPTKASPVPKYRGTNRLLRRLTHQGPSRVRSVDRSDSADDRVDIIIPTKNRAKPVVEAIASALDQSHANKTIWVSDDGSTDETRERIQSEFSSSLERGELRLLTGHFGGASAARNAALAASTSPWIAYLDSDNLMRPDHIRGLLDGVRAHRASWAYSDWLENGDIQTARAYDRFEFLQTNWVDLNTSIHARSLYTAYGGFDESLMRLNDYDLYLRFGRFHAPAQLAQATVEKRLSVDSISRTVAIREPFRKLRENHLEELIAFDLAPRHFICSPRIDEDTKRGIRDLDWRLETLPVRSFRARARDVSQPPVVFVATPEDWREIGPWQSQSSPFQIIYEVGA